MPYKHPIRAGSEDAKENGMTDQDAPTVREVRYEAWLPSYAPLLGKIVNSSQVEGNDLAKISGNPHDQGYDWGLMGPWVNGSTEFSAGVFKMSPDQVHPPHYHPESPELYYIVDGSCLLQVDDTIHDVGPETAIYLPVGCVHAVWTRENESVTIFYAFHERPGVRVVSIWLEGEDGKAARRQDGEARSRGDQSPASCHPA
jgi:quercetin dioxygenase-like cupin family protein